MTRSAIGTFKWCEATDGRLNGRERLTMVGMLIRAQLREAGDALLYSTASRGHSRLRVDADRVPLPDTQVVKDAEERARAVYGEPLLLHCYRTYWWSALLAQVDQLSFDPELLLVSSLLHDLGIAPDQLDHVGRCCFAVSGARQAAAFAEEHGCSADMAKRIYEAISLHLNPIVDPRENGPEAALLADGATLDVIGSRRRRLPSFAIAAVHARLPRNDFRREILWTIRRAHAAESRAAFLSAGFGFLASRNPLERQA